MSSFTDNIIIYIKKPQKLTKKEKNILELISDYSKVVEYKVNIESQWLFAYKQWTSKI